MRTNRAAFPLAAMCRVLGLSTSGYYGWLRRRPSARSRRDEEIKVRIMEIWIESHRTYGCPRIHAVLLAEGVRVSCRRVARLMRKLGIQGVTRRRFKTGTTKRDADAKPASDLVNRDFSAGGPNRLWVADITQVRIGGDGAQARQGLALAAAQVCLRPDGRSREWGPTRKPKELRVELN